MANQRDIKNRIKSITNTKKITKTMEMVSTSKMKKLQQRLSMCKPYDRKVNEIISNLLSSGISVSENPLFTPAEKVSKIMVLMITGNRGLCGSYNTNVINSTISFKRKMAAEGKDVQIYSIGKKGTNFLSFSKQPSSKSAMNPDDKLTFSDATGIGTELTEMFLKGEVHEVYIAYTKVVTSSNQKPAMIKLLPITSTEEVKNVQEHTSGMSKADYIFEPDAGSIFSYILPLYIKVKLFTCFLESSFSEQFSRRVAMKNATDASSDMIKELTISYNRVRQAKITKEISEIVGGAAAIE